MPPDTAKCGSCTGRHGSRPGNRCIRMSDLDGYDIGMVVRGVRNACRGGARQAVPDIDRTAGHTHPPGCGPS